MNVSTILKTKGDHVVTSTPHARLNEIITILNENRIGSVVIIDEERQVVGIVSERDVIAALSDKGGDVLDQPVSAAMTTKVYTCTQADTLEKLMAEMTAHRFRHLPVVEQGRLIGLVSIGDVVKQRIAEAELEAASLRDYIATG